MFQIGCFVMLLRHISPTMYGLTMAKKRLVDAPLPSELGTLPQPDLVEIR